MIREIEASLHVHFSHQLLAKAPKSIYFVPIKSPPFATMTTPATYSIEMQGQPQHDETIKAVNADLVETRLAQSDNNVSDGEFDIVYLQGAQFWLVCAVVAIMVFLVNLEVPVVITALVSIANDLKGFDIISWIVSSYLLGYVAFIVICAKFSDIFGRKIMFILSIIIFTIASGACAAAQTMPQLIVFRGFQGVGGGGCWSLATIFITELVPPVKHATIVSNIAIASALAFLVGPIIGGGIASNVTWRWIFIINIPLCALALILAVLFIPKEFPYRSHSESRSTSYKTLLARSTIQRIDTPGTILILLATLTLVAALQEAGQQFPWKSAYVITLLVISGFLWAGLAIWERHVTFSNSIREPILPWRFLLSREIVAVLLNFALVGGPTLIGTLILPQQYQLVYGTSGLEAGVRIIPFTALIAIGAMFSSVAGKHRVSPVYLLLFGSSLQILGFALLGKLPDTLEIPARIYGFQVLAGFGCGMNFSVLLVLMPIVTEKRDNAVGLGAGNQLRFIGGAVTLSIATALFNTYVQPRLKSQLGLSNVNELTQVLPSLVQEVQEDVRHTLATGYSRQILVLAVSAGLQIPSTLLLWRKKQL
ncbi:putative multidrug resistance protein fnx1, partial [Astrocystis sublimbata]